MTNEKLIALRDAIDALDDGETLIPYNIIKQYIIPLQNWLEKEIGKGTDPDRCPEDSGLGKIPDSPYPEDPRAYSLKKPKSSIMSMENMSAGGEVRGAEPKPPAKASLRYVVDFYDMFDGWIHYADIDKTYCFNDLEAAKRFCDNKNVELDPQNKKAGEHWGVIDLTRNFEVYHNPYPKEDR